MSKQQTENELTHLRQVIERISEEWEKARLNSDGDTVIFEAEATQIAMLLSEG